MIDWWQVGSYDIFISVTDGVHNDGPLVLTVTINDLRPVPVIENLAATTSINEDAVGGTMVFKVMFDDYLCWWKVVMFLNPSVSLFVTRNNWKKKLCRKVW